MAVGRRKGAHFMGGDEVVELHSLKAWLPVQLVFV